MTFEFQKNVILGLSYGPECCSGVEDELKELKSAIRSAYVMKELKAQMRETEARELGSRALDRLVSESDKRFLEDAKRRAENIAEGKRIAKKVYGDELKDAMAVRERKRIEEREFEVRERRVLEEVSRVMEEREELKKIADRFDMADRKARELRIFREILEIRKSEETQRREEERIREFDYEEMIERRKEMIARVRGEREIARAVIVEAVASSLLEARERELEIENVIEDLVIEEKLFEEKMRLEDDDKRRKAMREEILIDIERQKIIVEERKRRHQIEEKEFADRVMRRVFEDARIERLTTEAKRRKREDYRRALEIVIEERRTRRKEEIERLEENLREERRRDRDICKRVKDIRKMLIINHAENIADFIKIGNLSIDERAIVEGIRKSEPRIIDDGGKLSSSVRK